MRDSVRLPIVMLLLFAAMPLAGPKISFDTKSYYAGIAAEGQTEKLGAVFVVKNTGDSTLKLHKAQPACGCTKVWFDTLIRPGKTGRIRAELDVSKFGGGPLAKAITVLSNAKNDSIVQLVVTAKIRPIIDFSEPTICINLSHTELKQLYVSSRKTDLKVTDIFFKMEADRDAASNWRTDVPLTIDFTWEPVDSTIGGGYHAFRLTLLKPKTEKSVLGEYLLKFNHPDRPQMVLTGTILK